MGAMEDSEASNKELLVAGSNERHGKICERVRFMLEDEK